mmetsp:Transcript_12445/g.23852  ORF Transcript_12445/g.23852 Transcript_12445/m.23852 type:complete len:215 (-) Transcript_12445:745-1389(-)
MSCETNTRPPSNSFTALARASIDSMSKWFVGSSSNKMCGTSRPNFAKTTRDFCPSLSSPIFCICIFPLIPKRPKYFLRSSRASVSYNFSKNSRGVNSKSSTSTKCCVKRPIFKCPWGRMSPRVGCNSPDINFTRVVFPAPFGPTRATLESKSTPKLTLVYSGSQLGYPKETSRNDNTGGGKCPGSLNLKLRGFSSSGFSVKPARIIFANTFSFD